MPNAEKTIEAPAIDQAIHQIVVEIAARHAGTERVAVAGIANGGIRFAERVREALEKALARPIDFGTVDIAFYRDDLGRNPIPKVTEPSEFGFDVEGSVIILCDDVIFSGRTVRAALNDIFDQGRPAAVELAVLCDRGGRRLPIEPGYTGIELDVAAGHSVRVFLDPLDRSKDQISITPVV